MDYYLTSPHPDASDLDPIYSMFKSTSVKKVPILRVFGVTPAGQKACLHIHGIFPYLYVPMPPGDNPGFLYRLAGSLDKALNMLQSGTGGQTEGGPPQYQNSSYEHVYKVNSSISISDIM